MKETLKEEIEKFWKENGPMTHAEYDRLAKCAKKFCELGRTQIKESVQEFVDKGERCMDQSEGDQGSYSWWDGFHNCAQGIMRELEDEEDEKTPTVKIEGWIVRDKDDYTAVYNTKPVRGETEWVDGNNPSCPGETSCILSFVQFMFPEITWESEPKKVEIEIKWKK